MKSIHPIESLEAAIKILEASDDSSLDYVLGFLKMKLATHKRVFEKGYTL